MKNNPFSLDHIALLLQKCLKSKAIKPGKQAHASLLVTNTDMEVLSLSSKLVGMYAACGDMKSASIMFETIKTPNVFAVNWMVLASAFNGHFNEAIKYFSLLSESLNICNGFTFSVVLKACVGLMDVNKGKQVHGVVSKLCLGSDLNVGNGLIDMYCKCGNLGFARKVFDGMPERDVVSWTSMISGYCNAGRTMEALVFFERMELEGLLPNEFTWNVMIAAFARKGDVNATSALLGRMVKHGLVPDLVTWNAMISGFAQSPCPFEAFELFANMLVSGIRPNQVTVTGLLPACGLTGSIQRGREIHGLIYRLGVEVNVFIASALIDMYSKCGSMRIARIVFDQIPSKNAASWNALIGCYGKHGMVESAIELFERMQEEGLQADDATLTAILSACSHGGFVDKGLKIFRSMKQSYGIKGAKEHYACVVDMLCRSGRMVEAYDLVKELPFGVTDSILGAFFNGCKIHGRKDLAKVMSEKILKMKSKKPGSFVTLSNIYAADGEWEEVENVRMVMKEKKINKQPGLSELRRGDFLRQ